MRSLEQIVADNGGDNTPGLDTHNLTGRAIPLTEEGDVPYEPQWIPGYGEGHERGECEDADCWAHYYEDSDY